MKTDVSTSSSSTEQKAAEGRHGSWSGRIESRSDADDALVCECEQVSVAEVKYAMEEPSCA